MHRQIVCIASKNLRQGYAVRREPFPVGAAYGDIRVKIREVGVYYVVESVAH